MTKKLIEVDNELWKRFHKKCVNQDKTMREQLDIMLKKFLGEK